MPFPDAALNRVVCAEIALIAPPPGSYEVNDKSLRKHVANESHAGAAQAGWRWAELRGDQSSGLVGGHVSQQEPQDAEQVVLELRHGRRPGRVRLRCRGFVCGTHSDAGLLCVADLLRF